MNAEVGVILEEDVHPKVFTTLMSVIPLSKNIDFTIGGGLGYIYNSGYIDGLDSGTLAGTIRAGFKFYDRVFIGGDHYSMVFRHDPGRNPFRIGITWEF